MNPLVIYEYTSITVSIDNSVYDGGMPIEYYNIYLEPTKICHHIIFHQLLKIIKLQLIVYLRVLNIN